MKKLKLKITFVFLLGMFLSACGGGGGGSNTGAETTNPITAVENLSSQVSKTLTEDLANAGFSGLTSNITAAVLGATYGQEALLTVIPAAFESAYDAVQEEIGLTYEEKNTALFNPMIRSKKSV